MSDTKKHTLRQVAGFSWVPKDVFTGMAEVLLPRLLKSHLRPYSQRVEPGILTEGRNHHIYPAPLNLREKERCREWTLRKATHKDKASAVNKTTKGKFLYLITC